MGTPVMHESTPPYHIASHRTKLPPSTHLIPRPTNPEPRTHIDNGAAQTTRVYYRGIRRSVLGERCCSRYPTHNILPPILPFAKTDDARYPRPDAAVRGRC